MKIIKILITFSVYFIPAVCFSAAGDVNKTLTIGKSVSIKPSSCTLQISSERANKIVVRCKRPSSSSSKKSNITLRQGTKATIKSKGCFLAVKKRQPKSVVIKCQTTSPTATPTAIGSALPTNIPVEPTATSIPVSTATTTPTNTATPTLTPNAQAITDDNRLLTFNTSSSDLLDSEANLSGIAAGQTIVSIDRRPNNGMLYGLGYNPTTGVVQLYHISPSTGIARALGSTGSFVDTNGDPVRIGVDALTKIGMDFNPVADRIRVVTSNGQNFRINPNTGSFVDGSGNIGINMDGDLNTASISAGESAYTNNDTGSSLTTLYCVDPSTDALMIMSSQNAGLLVSQGTFNQNSSNTDILEIRGFDIAAGINVASSNSAVASGSGIGIFEFASNSQQRLATINLTNAEISQGTLIGDGTDSFLGFALQSAPTETVYALTSSGSITKFKSNNPSAAPTPINPTGLTSGETLVGIDFRPATGQLYGLGVDETTDTATLYTIDPQLFSLTVVGSASSISFVDNLSNTVQLTSPSSGYGFDFNPAVDRIRVTTGGGLNFRINPDTGEAINVSGVNTDSAINSEVSSLHATSYTNSFNGTTPTTQYGLDAASNKLVIVSPPNAGSTTLVSQIREAGNVLDFTESAALEIRSNARVSASGSAVSSGTALAALTVSGVSSLYEIDLTDGTATNLGLVAAGSDAIVGIAISEKYAK